MNKKQFLHLCSLFVTAIALISWGVTGHRTIGRIAANHLSPQASAAVRELLGSETLAEASTWPDEVRSQPEYKHTGPWHYINLPLGLSEAEFEKTVKGMTQENVYSALLQQEQALGSTATTKQQKIEALKFIVHFIGDLHQPMHVSREEDKGGNTIQINYSGVGTNLHALWDSKLLDHLGLDDQQLAQKVDQVSNAQVTAWQNDPLIKWIWESYVISSKLYAEIDAMNGRSIDDSYYQAHILIVQQRIEMAGVRLAGVLNRIFASGLATSSAGASASAAGNAQPAAAGGGNTSSSASAGSGWDGQIITVTGKIVSYKDKPEIVVTDPTLIVVTKQ